ncbi:MAG: hypothetical protein Q9184_006112 [Pyrenodesmia sp. 2 TL-2023]
MPVTSDSPSNSSLIVGFRGEVVTVLVGPEKEAFHVHKTLLMSKSAFFRGAFECGFKEAINKTLTLDEDDPDCFSRYILWVYNQVLEPIRSSRVICEAERGRMMLERYCKLFILADKLGSEPLQNLCIDLVHEYASNHGSRKDHLDATIVNYVWDNTMEGSPLRAILIDLTAWGTPISRVPDLVNPKSEFLFEALRACSERSYHSWEGPLDANKCQTYHVHRDKSDVCPKVW